MQKRRMLSFPFVAVCPSDWTKRMAQESRVFEQASFVVIANPLDTQFWKPAIGHNRDFLAPSLERCRTLKILFGAAGGLKDPRKGWALLQDALRYLDANRPEIPVRLEIFGENGEPEFMGNCAIIYLGALDEAGMRAAYRRADVFIATPLIESFGQTVTESQSCGTPVIGSATGGLKDTIESGRTGHLLSDRSPSELARKLAEAFDSPGKLREMGTRARERAMRLWSMETVGAQYIDLYRKILSQPNGHSA